MLCPTMDLFLAGMLVTGIPSRLASTAGLEGASNEARRCERGAVGSMPGRQRPNQL